MGTQAPVIPIFGRKEHALERLVPATIVDIADDILICSRNDGAGTFTVKELNECSIQHGPKGPKFVMDPADGVYVGLDIFVVASFFETVKVHYNQWVDEIELRRGWDEWRQSYLRIATVEVVLRDGKFAILRCHDGTKLYTNPHMRGSSITDCLDQRWLIRSPRPMELPKPGQSVACCMIPADAEDKMDLGSCWFPINDGSPYYSMGPMI